MTQTQSAAASMPETSAAETMLAAARRLTGAKPLAEQLDVVLYFDETRAVAGVHSRRDNRRGAADLSLQGVKISSAHAAGSKGRKRLRAKRRNVRGSMKQSWKKTAFRQSGAAVREGPERHLKARSDATVSRHQAMLGRPGEAIIDSTVGDAAAGALIGGPIGLRALVGGREAELTAARKQREAGRERAAGAGDRMTPNRVGGTLNAVCRKIVTTNLGDLIVAVTDEVKPFIQDPFGVNLVVAYIVSDVLLRRDAPASKRLRRMIALAEEE